MSLFFRIIFSATLFLNLLSCSTVKNIDKYDPKAKLSKGEYKAILYKNRKNDLKDKKDSANFGKIPPIPNLSGLTIDAPQIIRSEKLVSLTVNEDVPLKDVLIELSRLAEIDVDMEPEIEGGIILSVTNKPLTQVLERICYLGNLRYSYNNGVIHFQRDLPYSKNYIVDFLKDGELWDSISDSISAIISKEAVDGEGSVNLNKSAGILTVFADSKIQKTIESFLRVAKRNASAQVLIEAKLVEVVLNEGFKTGIDWQVFNEKNTSDVPLFKFNETSFVNTTDKDGNLDPSKLISGVISLAPKGVKWANINLNATLSLLKTFGTTRTLSSPRIHAINNTKATLDFTTNKVYFEIDSTTVAASAGSENTTQDINSTKQEVALGIKLEITPAINLDTREITMKIVPTLTVLSDYADDPATSDLTIKNKVPVVQERKIDTVMKMRDGEMMVIGGLMEESSENKENGIPFLSSIPILGHLFKSTSKVDQLTETVIFIKTTIVDGSNSVNDQDRAIYEKFATNKRFDDLD